MTRELELALILERALNAIPPAFNELPLWHVRGRELILQVKEADNIINKERDSSQTEMTAIP
jgi:hypothetical protein